MPKMAIFDRFRSRQDNDSAQHSSSPAPQEVLQDQPSTSRHLGEELRDTSASSSVPAAFSTEDIPTFYNPYEGLSAAIDNRAARGVYKLPQQPEFLFSEEATVHRRGWGENLTYYTGTGYLSGACRLQCMLPSQQGSTSFRLGKRTCLSPTFWDRRRFVRWKSRAYCSCKGQARDWPRYSKAQGQQVAQHDWHQRQNSWQCTWCFGLAVCGHGKRSGILE